MLCSLCVYIYICKYLGVTFSFPKKLKPKTETALLFIKSVIFKLRGKKVHDNNRSNFFFPPFFHNKERK